MSSSSPSKGIVWIISSATLAVGFIIGSFLISELILKARLADRSVTVRGLAEKDVTADLATWTLAYSAQGKDLKATQDNIDADTKAIKAYGNPNITIRQRMTLRTTNIELAQQAVTQQFDLIRRGVVLEDGSGMSYTFTKLDKVKPEMVAAATQDARRAAQQFAEDSGADVGGIKSATQIHLTRKSAWSRR